MLTRLVAFAAFFAPAVALAQDAAPAAEGFNWLPLVLGGLGAAVMLVSALGGWKWLRQKIDQGFDYLAMKTKLGFLANVDEILVGFALDLYHSEIKLLKAEGRWGPETGAKVLAKLKEKAKQHFGLEMLSGLAGGGSEAEVDSFLSSRAESAVVEAKNRGRAAKAKKAEAKPVDPSKA